MQKRASFFTCIKRGESVGLTPLRVRSKVSKKVAWRGEQELDEDEFLDVVKVPFAEVVEMIMRGEIPDAKTQTAVLKAKYLLGI